MYGLDSAQLDLGSHIKNLENFHLKGLRKILKLDTTFGQKIKGQEMTNNKTKIYAEASKKLNIKLKTDCKNKKGEKI